MKSVSYKIKFVILGALIVPCFGRIALHGTNFEYDFYRYLVPLIVGGLSGYFIGMMKDKWLITNKKLNKTNQAMKQEIKDHRTVRKALQESEEKYRISYQSAPYGILVYDHNLNIFIFNSHLEQITGYNKENIPDVTTWFEKIYPDEEYRKRVMQENKNISTKEFPRIRKAEITCKNGQKRTCTFHSTLLSSGLRTVFINDITDDKQAEERLKKSEEQSKRYLKAIDSMNLGIFIVDSDYHIRHMNKTMIKWFGDQTGSNCHQSIAGLTSPCTYCKLRPVIESNKIVHYTPTTPDGRSFDIMCYPIQNTDGSISKMEIIRDITIEKQAEDMLRESEERFRKIIEDVSEIAIQGYDEKRRVTFWNQASKKLYGYIEQDALGKKLEDLIIPLSMHKEIKKLHHRWLEYGEEIPAGELRLMDSNGNDVPVFSSHVMHETQHGKEMFCIDIDLKPIRQAEEALRESEEKYRALIETTDTGYLILDKKGKVIDANIEYIRLSGHQTIDEILGRSVVEWTAPHDHERNAQEVKKCMELGYVKNLEIDYINKDGKIIPVEINATTVSTDKGFRILSLCQDITERKQAEKEKIEAQKIAGEQKKLALIGQVAGKMAHDFNNIMGIIMGNAELSLMDCKDARIRKTLELIFKQTLRGKNLTKNLVAFAKSQEPRQEFFRINETVDLVINLLKKDIEGIELIREDKANMPDLLADSGMIEHALLNLMQNSIHAISMVEHPRIIIRTYSLNDNICLEIEDNGCGIPDKSLDNIYEPSFTLKGSRDITGSYKPGIKGTGYGMSNVKKYIEQHRGNILVESTFGLGTKFTISLPVVKTELTKKEKAQIRKEKVHYNKYILIVEDEPAISGVQYKILSQEPCNHKVDIANDGQVAMDLFKRNEYDLISLDYVLPGNINGMDVYNHIRETNKTIPILFISGNIEFLESIKELKQKDGYIDHLSKPCQNKDYVKSINELFAQT